MRSSGQQFLQGRPLTSGVDSDPPSFAWHGAVCSGAVSYEHMAWTVSSTLQGSRAEAQIWGLQLQHDRTETFYLKSIETHQDHSVT